MYLLKILLISMSFVVHSYTYRILGIFNFPSKSMHLAAVTMAKVLEERGHNVTLVTPYRKSSSKYHEHIFLKEINERMNQNHPNYFEMHSPYLQSYVYQEMGVSLANMTYAEPALQQLLNSKNQFDILILDIIFNESLMYIAEHLGIPIMLYTSQDASQLTNNKVGNPSPPSYVPMILSHYTSDMTFLQRLDNLFLYTFFDLYNHFIAQPKQDHIVKTYFPEAPHISEYCYKPTVVLLNADAGIMDPMPKVPGMIDIGGYHIEEAKPLPKDIESILNEAEHGVIYFSMGTNLKSSQISNETLNALIKSFSKLKQTILWKWDDEELSNRPKNVVARKWLPQNDILAHKNIKLFISHGGLHSLMETVYHGVPSLIIPVFVDQIRNAIKASQKGYACYLPFSDISTENLDRHLNELLNDPRYMNKAKQMSNIMKDKPISQKDKLIYWVEYVIRHKGAEHLKMPSLKLNWFQYFLLDVILFIVTISLILLISLIILTKRIVGTKKQKSNSDKMKTN